MVGRTLGGKSAVGTELLAFGQSECARAGTRPRRVRGGVAVRIAALATRSVGTGDLFPMAEVKQGPSRVERSRELQV